jgi:hypothetical protein
MPTHDTPDHPLSVILGEAFAPQLESGEVDLVETEGTHEFEIQADEWTLLLAGWPVTGAFIALDEEPATLLERRAALDAALDTQHFAGLRRANDLLNGAIVAALEDSGDELSTLLAQTIALIGPNVEDDPVDDLVDIQESWSPQTD